MKVAKPYIWWIIDLVIIFSLLICFGYWFFWSHAYGAWGDDSPGYIYTAGQIQKGESLVAQDSLVQAALNWFGDEHYARFVAPVHHEIISPTGWIASRYPIGLGLLMALVNWLTSNDTAMYSVVPGAAVGTVILTYILTILWLPISEPLKRLGGMIAALSVGLADIFANYAVAQPMREIPSIIFWLGTLILLTCLYKLKRLRWKIVLAILAGILFGFSIDIRETSAILLLPILIWLWPNTAKWWKNQVTRSEFIKIMLAGCLGLALGLSVAIWTAVTISAHKEKFREKDISSIAITSNFDHIQSLSFSNLFNNQGKFKPGVGGVEQYWEVISQFSTFVPFIFFAVIGLIVLWFKQRKIALVIGSWIATIFILFAMWINPYARYILPLLPAIAILAAYGIVVVIDYCLQSKNFTKIVRLVLAFLILCTFFITLKPLIAARNEHIKNNDLVYKAISLNDLTTLKEVSNQLVEKSPTERPALLMMFGSWRAGLPETIMTHTNLRVIRFPGREKEQPDLNKLASFLTELQKTYTVYLWYDNTLSSGEQRFWQKIKVSDPIITTQLTFQSDIIIYALTKND